MSLKSRYFIKIQIPRGDEFEQFLTSHNLEYSRLSVDMSAGNYLYSVQMDSEDAIAMKIIFPLNGCMNFTRTIGNLKETQ